ncbi:hypothetical protein EV2_019748 [Malus domestica]
MGESAKIYETVDKLRRDLPNKEHMRLVDLERRVKTLKEVVSDFAELAAEATHVQTLVRTTDLNSQAKRLRRTPKTSYSNILMFSGKDLEDVNSPHDDVLVIKVQIFNAMVSCILIDNVIGVNIFFKDRINRIRILDNINKSKTLRHTFSRTFVRSLGMVKLAIQDELYTYFVFYHVIDCVTPHNAIIRRN